ncbi:MAG: sigma-54-dependent transcriptional regulator [Verrucomicrobiales bacterium]
MQTVLVIDPDSDFLLWASKHLSAPEVRVLTAADADQGFAIFQKEKPDLVLLELHLKPVSGMELLRRLRQTDPNALVALNSGFPPTNAVIEAMKLGAYEFLRKESLSYELRPVVEDALKTRETMKATAPLAAPQLDHLQQTIIGQSPAMQSVFKMIGRASRSVAPVMITGESGCGKEVVARAIHKFSPRQHKEFVAINCAAIPETLLESELFGHEKGSFTGATAQRMGRFEQCDGGTLFLDEIGDMPFQVQSKILRVLQEGEFSRVGGNQTLRTDVRILAATNRNLERDVETGRFREDLFYRLNVIRIHLPPLRERREDILPLAGYFLQRLAREHRLPPHRLSEEAVGHLNNYHWPGNVRELENTLERACVLATADVLLPKDIPLGTGTLSRATSASAARESAAESRRKTQTAADSQALISATARLLLQEAEAQPGLTLLASLERELMLQAYEKAERNASRAAGLLGLTADAFNKKFKSLLPSKGAN